jgi:hypothetical protein
MSINAVGTKITEFNLRVRIVSDDCNPEQIAESLRNKLNSYYQELDDIVQVELVVKK